MYLSACQFEIPSLLDENNYKLIKNITIYMVLLPGVPVAAGMVKPVTVFGGSDIFQFDFPLISQFIVVFF